MEPDSDQLLRWMNPTEWSQAQKEKLQEKYEKDITSANPTTYHIVRFRSALEAHWARTLDGLNIIWEYEPWLYHAPSGERYLPDFWLPSLRTFIEVKGAFVQRIHKTHELASEIQTDDIIVLVGLPPHRTSQSPYAWESKLKWYDPLGYDTRLAQCVACKRWQWLRAQLSCHCRACNEPYKGLLAKSGEMPFKFIEAEPPIWMRKHG